MSGRAVRWAMKERGLKSNERIALIYLCDPFTEELGCFPSQSKLAKDTELSRATLNRALRGLEAKGLIRRIRRTNAATGKQMSTVYVLGFQSKADAEQQHSRRLSRSNPESQKRRQPCTKTGENRVPDRDTNLRKEKNNEGKHRQPRRERSTSAADDTQDTLKFWAQKIKSGGYVPPSAVTPARARDMLAADLVTKVELRAAGITW